MQRVGTNGYVDYRTLSGVEAGTPGMTRFSRNDVLVAKITPCFENGKGACLDAMPVRFGHGSSEYHVLRCTSEVHPRYLYLRTADAVLRAEGVASMTGSAGQKRVPAEFFKNFVLCLPPLDEQALIVRYLNHAEIRIAKAVAAKQGLVRLLHERRSAIEAELLLGEPDASTGSWFGRLPDGWSKLPARAICSERIQRGREDLDLLSVTIRRGVIPQREYFSTDGSKKDQSRTDKTQYKVVKSGDVVYNKMRAWQGAAGCSTFEGIVSPAYVVIQPNQLVDPHFLGRVMRTPQFAKEAERWSYGINSDMWSLRPQHFKLIEFAVPPLEEQREIARRIGERTAAIDAAMDAVNAEVALLKEYRTRLISDVVTGKIDVREEAAKLPDIDPAELAAVLAGGAAGADEEEVADGDD